jgi:hypothetical protein
MRILALSMLLGLLPALAPAADLVNRDGRSYDLKIHDAGTTHTSISGNTTRMGVCRACRLEVEGVGEIEVTEQDSRVTIKDGQFEKE